MGGTQCCISDAETLGEGIAADSDGAEVQQLQASVRPRRLGGTNMPVRWRPVTMEKGSFTLVALCVPALLADIGAFLTGRCVADIVHPFLLTARWLAVEAEFAIDGLWESMCAARWEPFYQAYKFHLSCGYAGSGCWRTFYKDMLASRCSCLLEVFERERKPGFDMAAMPAIVSYDVVLDSFIAKYISASDIDLETISAAQIHRIRFCPPSVLARLKPGPCPNTLGLTLAKKEVWTSSEEGDAAEEVKIVPALHSNGGGTPHRRLVDDGATSSAPCSSSPPQRSSPAVSPAIEMGAPLAYGLRGHDYPYKVLEGVEDLVVGQGVELQWKMQELSPFGWWFGELESLQHDPDGRTAKAIITFAHFPENSLWYRLALRFGDSSIRHCKFGGFTGGIRPVTSSEKLRWMLFFPSSSSSPRDERGRFYAENEDDD